MSRKIAVVTGTRAEFGILEPLLKRIVESSELELQLLVTGMHLLKKYGYTIREIIDAGFKVTAKIPMYYGDESDEKYYGFSLARAIHHFTKTLANLNSDFLVVFGDRLEALAATLAGATLKMPIAHIHGGDKTDSGHIDESIRHAITRFAHIHFTATEGHTKRLIMMGEEPWRVHKVGALGLDSILSYKPISRDKLSDMLKVDFSKPVIVCLFHPVHLEENTVGFQMHNILSAISELKYQTVIIYPNNDLGSQKIIDEINRFSNLPFIRVFPSLSHNLYISLLHYASVLVGNSSSGIIEAPSLKLPVVNVGSRNVGREHADNVIFVDGNDKEKIKEAILKALNDEEFKKKVKNCKNPYGDGKASERIVEILSKIKIDKKLLQKKITY